MKEYQRVLRAVVDHGRWHKNRTGVETKRLFGWEFRHDMRTGFPAVTVKRLAFRPVVAELIGFLRGVTSAAAFRELGAKIWDKDANENGDWLRNPSRMGRDDLGPIYGKQWRRWQGPDRAWFDQIEMLLRTIHDDPNSRRMIVNAWNVADIRRMALVPCHMSWQVNCDCEMREMDLRVDIRSWDLFLGAPFNIASYGLLLELLCIATHYSPRDLIIHAGDVHVYSNHMQQVETLFGREPLALPKLNVRRTSDHTVGAWYTGFEWLVNDLEPQHVLLENYVSHDVVKGEMATTPKEAV